MNYEAIFAFYFLLHKLHKPAPSPSDPIPPPLPPTLYLRLFIVGAAQGGERRLAEGETLNLKP